MVFLNRSAWSCHRSNFRAELLPVIRFFLILCLVALSTRAADKPNIIFFMADDMGMGDTSAFQDFTGNADNVQLHTPQMETVGADGCAIY